MFGYSALLLAVLVVGAPYWLLRMATSGRYRAGLGGRLGWVPHALRRAVRGRRVIWVHAVSVGEVMAATPLILGLRAALPGWVIAVSTTTETGQRLAMERLGGTANEGAGSEGAEREGAEREGAEREGAGPDPAASPVFYLPLDFAYAVRRYLRVLRPKMVVLMESELWPRLIEQSAGSGVPVVVVNARISDRSLPRYLRLRPLWQPVLRQISLYLAQSEESAGRLRRMGAPAERVRVTGNLKYDLRAGGERPLTELLRSRLQPGARVVVCGSTLDGEERVLLDIWPGVLHSEPGAVMVLAPRRPERFGAVAEMVARSGMELVRASEFQQRPVALRGGSVVLLDTIGDLASVYSLAEVAFVGGSLGPSGGHNPLEPARFAVPVVMGPSFENFREMVEVMQTHDAVRIVSAAMLGTLLIALLRDTVEARALGERGRAVFEAQSGATERTVGELMALLEERTGRGR